MQTKLQDVQRRIEEHGKRIRLWMERISWAFVAGGAVIITVGVAHAGNAAGILAGILMTGIGFALGNRDWSFTSA